MKEAFHYLNDEEKLALFMWAVRTRALIERLILYRGKIFGACLVGLLQELVSLIPMAVLYHKGIFRSSVKHGDHRTLWAMSVIADVVNEQLPERERCPYNHVRETFRNHFGKATGGNKGRDGNTHIRGCEFCRIIGLIVSDMGRLPLLAAAYIEAIRRFEFKEVPKDMRPVAVAFWGDGAEQQGAIHEMKNWIAASNCPLSDKEYAEYDERFFDDITKETKIIRGGGFIGIINNNTKALFANAREEYGRANLTLRAQGYNMHGFEVRDCDFVKYYDIVSHAVEEAQQFRSSIIHVHSYRGTGHNADQIAYEPGALERFDFGAVTKVFGIKDLSEFKEAWENDPVLVVFKNYIIDSKIASADRVEEIIATERASMKLIADEVLEEPDITVEEDKKDRTLFPSIDWSALPCYSPVNKKAKTKVMGYNEAFTWIIEQLMREDERVVYFGEDCGSPEGGVLGLTKGLVDKFGPSRIWNTPISEEMIVGAAAGMGLYGMRPFGEFQFEWFYKDANAMLSCIAAQWFQKKLRFSFVNIFPCGVVRTGGSGQYHEWWPEGDLHTMEGIAIAVPSNAREVVGIVRAAYEFGAPVAILLQISAANFPEFQSDVPLEPYVIPFGKAIVEREGNDITVVAYGAACVHAAKNEADFLEKEEGISVEVVNPLTLNPLDVETIRNSVRKTKRILTIHEATERGGLGPYILYKTLLEGNGGVLEYLYPRFAQAISAGMEGDVFIPSARQLVWARLPYYKDKKSVIIDGNEATIDIHRSRTLARWIREAMEYR